MIAVIGPETPGDAESIHRLNTTAFEGRTEEADLVDALRESGELLVS
ncbi:MAG: GNAT family N-acetyltransferase, partial [bacterium]|nr:GNAT family N-acetyltransferase [bacterium]